MYIYNSQSKGESSFNRIGLYSFDNVFMVMRARCAPLGPAGGNKKDTQEFQRTESHSQHYPTCRIYNERIWRKNR
jgi:hypothetical protein